MIAALLLSASLGGEPVPACRAELERAYDGSTGTALAHLSESNRRHENLLCAYLEVLVRAFDLEQRPQSATRDAEQLERVDRLVGLAEAHLQGAARDPHARFVHGAAYGLASRLHLLRRHKRAAARNAARMREDLLLVADSDPLWSDAQFGLGLYDYYADVLPRMLKLLRLLTGLPGGDRLRGLGSIELAQEHARLHATEARVQLFDIYAFYEGRDDDALGEMLELRRRYPGAPLWGLKLCEHQLERLGQPRDAAATAREILRQSSGGHPNYAPVVGGMARVLLGEALLGDLKPGDAVEALEAALDLPLPSEWRARAQLALGRALERRGERRRAERFFRDAARADDERLRAEAEAALHRPSTSAFLASLEQIAAGRRLRAEGRAGESAAAFARGLALDPDSQECRLRVAEAQIDAGRLPEARTQVEALLDQDDPEPPWVRPWSRLLSARLDDLAGRRDAALKQYNQVFKEPLGSAQLRDLAGAGLRRPFQVPDRGEASPERSNHSR